MRRLILIISVMAAALLPMSLRCGEVDDLFAKLRRGKNVIVDSVRYTGSDFKKSEGGFRMQRGAGKGWTRGERITIENVSPRERKRVESIFNKYLEKGDGFSKDNWACLYFERSREFYGYEYCADNNRLWLLKASTDGEICVPAKWVSLDYVDATKHNPLAGADTCEIKLLGLSRLWEGVNRWFVFRDRMTENWDSIYVRAMGEMASARTEDEWADVLRKMIAHAHDGHTMVYGYDGRCTAPFTTVMIDSCVYVKDVFFKNLDVKSGDRIESVDGMPVWEYANKKVIPYIASSTPQWTVHEAFDGFGLLKRLPGDTVKVELGGGKIVEYVAGEYDVNAPEKPIFELDWPSEGVALLKIDRFMGGDNFKRQLIDLYDDLYDSKGLIIDLRGNEGGNSGNGDLLMRVICADTIATASWSSPVTIPAFASWGKTPEPYCGGGEKLTPIKGMPVYDKPIVVLADRGTFSAAEDFIGLFRGAKRGVVIGSPTGGSTGNGVRIELIPNHTWANICSKHDTAPDGTEFVGVGFKPDIFVEETWESVFEDKVDRATAKAMEYLDSLGKR